VPIRLGSTVIQGTRAGGARRASLPWPSPSNEFRMIKSAEETSHLEHVKDRRSQADGPLDGRIIPPQGPSGGVQGRPDGRAVAQAEGLISLPDPPD